MHFFCRCLIHFDLFLGANIYPSVHHLSIPFPSNPSLYCVMDDTYNHCYGLYSQRKNVEYIELIYTFTGYKKNYKRASGIQSGFENNFLVRTESLLRTNDPIRFLISRAAAFWQDYLVKWPEQWLKA
jgi:hypothetical protein